MELEELRKMVKAASGAVELYHVATFKGERDDHDGKHQQLTVEIKDGGPLGPGGRYHVTAWASDGSFRDRERPRQPRRGAVGSPLGRPRPRPTRSRSD
jgi:hypothetical protein